MSGAISMGRLLALTGIVLTALYGGFAWWLVGDRISTLQTMGLNEVGDFLAGAFGPLAILWLVLGFFQQGIELRQSTSALLLQADELKATVSQQKEMVAVSRAQLAASLSAERSGSERMLIAMIPKPILIDYRYAEASKDFAVVLALVNKGGAAFAVKLSSSRDSISVYPRTVAIWDDDTELEISLSTAAIENFEDQSLRLNFKDKLGNEYLVELTVSNVDVDREKLEFFEFSRMRS